MHQDLSDAPTLDSNFSTAGGLSEGPSDSFHAAILKGSAPELGKETCDLLRTRLEAFGIFLSGAMILGIVRSFLMEQPPTPALRALHVGLIFLVALLTLTLFLKPDLPARVLRLIELAIVLPISVLLLVGQYNTIKGLFAIGKYELILSYLQASVVPFIILILLYGLFIPNTIKRATLIIVPMSLLPLLLRFFLRVEFPEIKGLLSFGEASYSFFSLFLAATASILGTYIISGLRVEVFRARQLGQYRLVEKIGSGGMGEVWRASHRMLARPAAIKLIRPDMLGNQDPEASRISLQRFEREAQATATLSSPHCIMIYDFGITDDGTFYYVMELLRGMDLASLVNRFGALPSGRVIHFLLQACEALEDAHYSGLIHRDVKPGNIFACCMGRESDYIKVLDFGLVKTQAAPESATITRVGTVTGTPAFMAPEQGLGEQVDCRTDLYSLGCVGYWLLTGQLVFGSPNPTSLLIDHVKTEPVPPSVRSEFEIPSDLEAVVMQCLKKAPEDRPSSARELIQALKRCRDAGSWTPERADKWWHSHLGHLISS